jgi:hypothetical protein
VFATTNPAAAQPSWKYESYVAIHAAVGCASTTFCAIGDTFSLSEGVETGNPVADLWSPVLDLGGGELAAIACPSSTECVAAASNGYVSVGLGSTLTVSLAGTGSGSVSDGQDNQLSCPGTCSATYAIGTTETLTATPSPGSTFSGWSGGGCSGTGPCTVAISAGSNVTASFATIPAVSGPAPSAPISQGQGVSSQTVSVTIDGQGSVSSGSTTVVSCPGACFVGGLKPPVTLEATPAVGWTFTGWSGGCSGVGACSIPAVEYPTSATIPNENVTATFAELPEVSSSVVTPTAPAITQLKRRPGSVTIHLTRPAGAVELQCALVMRRSGKGAHQAKPHYTACGKVKTFSDLRRGTYVLFARSVGPGGRDSSPTKRTIAVS